MENETEVIDSTNDTEKTENQEEGTTETTEDIETLKKENETLKGENKTLKAQKDHWRNKVEKKPETPIEEKEETTEPKFSIKDIAALSKVHEDDIDTVTDWARFKGISVTEALKDKTLKTVLSERADERKTAEATAVKPRGGTVKKDDADSLIKDMEKGKMPENDSDMEKLVVAEWEERKKK